MKNFVLAVTFLTRIHIPNRYIYSDEDFAKSIVYYPIVGIILGGILGILTYALQKLIPNPDLNAFIILFIYIALSGGLHLDGLADVCDGLFSSRSREKIFEIMKDSRVGAFGVIGLILYFLGMWVALKQANWQMVFLFPIVGRCSILLTAGMSQYAKECGLGKSIVESASKTHILLGGLVGIIASLFINMTLVLPVVITFLGIALLTKRISKVLCGITGDVMGLMVEVSQCIFLLVAILFAGIGVNL